MRKITEKGFEWRHVPTSDNPADIGSRGSTSLQQNDKWLIGPPWLSLPTQWSPEIVPQKSKETEAEAKLVKEILSVSVDREPDAIDVLITKKRFWQTVRVLSWAQRFIKNCRQKQKVTGPLSTDETEEEIKFLIKRAQRDSESTNSFKSDCGKLNLKRDEHDIFRCQGRIQGDYPMYMPFKNPISDKLVERAHLQTLHGGVILTMAKVRDQFWIPKLRSIVKRVRKECHGCKRFQVTSLPAPPQGNLPKERSEGTIPFNVIGVDYAGPIVYRGKGKVEHKGYIILYTCSLTRGLHLEFLPNMNCDEIFLSFKRYIAARGRPSKVISDNGKTFVAASKWIKRIRQNEKMQDYLAQHSIRWQFNLSRASWWGGIFERMVGIVKSALYKATGAAKLTFKEMQDVLLDVQLVINNRPLSYCEDDIQLPTLTPNMLIFGKANYLPEEQLSEIEDKDLRKRAKYILRCKESLWKRWKSEYLRALRERHDAKKPR